MKRIVMFSAAGLTLAVASLYGQAPGETSCNNATLQGSYGILLTGMEPAPSVLPNFPSALYVVGTPEAVVGLVHNFDGNGKFTQVDNVKGYLSGIVLDRPGGGTYTVNPDCSGSYNIFIPGLSFPVLVVRFVVVDAGKEFRGIVVTPQLNMVTANGRKIH